MPESLFSKVTGLGLGELSDVIARLMSKCL